MLPGISRQSTGRGRGNRPRRLRKQPRVRRVQSAAIPMPRHVVGEGAQRRRRRNRQQRIQMKLPTATAKQIVGSPRWISLALLWVSLYAMYTIGIKGDYYLTYIPVEGLVTISPDEIVAASGLAGAHIFSANPELAAARINELPGVISATVTLEWPNLAQIAILEDTPVAIWQQAGKEYWINEQGYLMPARQEMPELLHIQSESTELMEDAEGNLLRAFVPLELLAGAQQLQALRPDLGTLYYRPNDGLSFDDPQGWRAFLGVGTNMNQKLAVYQAIVGDLQARSLQPEYISVSNPTKPFYRAFGLRN